MSRERSRKKVLYVALACLALGLAGTGIATALPSTSTTGSAGSRPAPTQGSATTTLSPTATSDFAVFAQPASTASEVALVKEIVGSMPVALGPSAVRLAQTADAVQARVAGDSESLCLVARVPGKAMTGGCATVATAVAPGTPVIVDGSYPGAPEGQVYGAALFPNGTANATLTDGGGHVTSLNIANNTVAFVAGPTDVLGWTGPEGHAYNEVLPS